MAVLPAPSANAVEQAPRESSSVAPAQRDELLGRGWQESGDRLWTTSGDQDGLRLLVAEAKTGYTWRTAATLSVPGVQTDQWIGNACVTGSGRKAVVVYAPRTFTNDEQLATRGGFTAVVDLTSGAVTRLPIRTSLAYFNPGCGAGETAALTQEGDIDLGKTGVTLLDTTSNALGQRTELKTQVTSATPVDGGFVVADSAGVLRVNHDGSKRRVVQNTGGVPRQLRADADGGVVYVDADNGQDRVRRAVVSSTADPATAATTLATGPSGEVALARGLGGKVFITGATTKVESLPAPVRKLDVPAGSEVSTSGDAAITAVETKRPQIWEAKSAADQLRIRTKNLRSGKDVGFVVDPAATLTPRWDETVDPNRVCSVPRNDPGVQVYQPKPKQVEWAADMAVSGHLDVRREPNWNNNGISFAYTPQEQLMFPRAGLTGGGQVPAQILLGVLGQESNLWQADRRTIAGQFGNPLVGNYYGTDIYNKDANGNPITGDDWDIRWDKADCGYGPSQMTDGMRLPGKPKPDKPNDPPLSEARQYAIGTDYAANVAAGLQLLEIKWNELQAAGMRLNDNNPARIENWFYTVWAYNSGFHRQGESGANGAWGLGWLNNPANPRYPARQPFGLDPHDFAKPQKWPYPEKVFGFAAYPPSGYEGPGQEIAFFRAAWWGGTDNPQNPNAPGTPNANKRLAWPPANQFCTASNQCQPNTKITPTAPEVRDEPAGPCAHTNTAGQTDLKCWVHEASVWRNPCGIECGHEYMRYDWAKTDQRAEPINAVSYPAACTNDGISDQAMVVDDVKEAVKPVSVKACKIRKNSEGATFSLDFGGKSGNDASGRIDLHQSGGGYGAHFWYGHTRPDTEEGRKLAINATWKFPAIDGLAKVKVHIPDHLANAKVDYVVDTATGPRTVPVDQRGTFNRWVTLGTFPFFNAPTVHLSTIKAGSDGFNQVAFDAVALEPEITSGGGSDLFQAQIKQDDNPFCLMLKDNNPKDNALVEGRPCNAWTEGYWTFKYINQIEPEIPDGPDTLVLIKDTASGLCLVPVEPDRPTEGGAVHELACNADDTAQRWVIRGFSPTAQDDIEILQHYRSRQSLRLTLPTGESNLSAELGWAPARWQDGKTFLWDFQ
ncbi:hypothetical protein [Lentzea aerocolonigenes]|uniref:golvesin C-terminal-like domain-containing protein n=1 Tax=Lentzea aerocolonigenes TaxID=68170 RepID=UPI00069764CA|nr:hypothetical protein [Lentzea aerocolonigenes]